MSLFRPSELHQFLKKTGMKANKRLSQNFLIDGNIIQKILKAAGVQKGDIVIEIGSGPGALTEALLLAGAHVVAIEKDRGFSSELQRLQTEDCRLEIFAEDCLSFPWKDFLAKKLKGTKKAKVVSNLPYHLTTPIIAELVPLHDTISSLTLMVQKEVAIRFCAKKGSADYSSFTIFLEYFCKASYCFTIEPTCFYPRPSVHSAIVHFILEKPTVSLPDQFFTLVRTAFQGRRKMLSTSLRKLYAADNVKKALEKTGLSSTARPEELSLSEFTGLFQELSFCKEQQQRQI